MHRYFMTRLTLLALCLSSSTVGAQQSPIRGFPTAMLAEQAAREAQLRAVPHADSLRERMRLLSEEPHEAGTERSRRVAELILAKFRAAGLDAQIERFEALMPRPISRSLELLSPTRFTATLAEQPVDGDKDSGDADQIPTFNAYSPDGDVTGELVFVNYGIPEDYRVLDSLGISVAGKIVIAKYGRSWRGIKPKLAAEHGAIGAILYSDPRDDGYWVDDVYPEGPMRPGHGVQRGSVMDMPVHPGDPLSPGWASEPGARKLAIAEAKTIERIPVQPIGYEDALPLLRALDGALAPEAWRGALPLTYHIGPGPARVRLALRFEWETRPLYNVIARIEGARSPDHWIVHGNHHDSWVNGAQDPISGMVALEETARALGTLLRSGWRPARTIILAAWDGEEWGLIGSTEWAEKHRIALDANAVAYLNSDSNDKGWLQAGGSHSLETFTYEVARDIVDPHRDQTVLRALLAREASRRPPPSPADLAPAARPDSLRTPDDSLLAREQERIRGERRRTAAPPVLAAGAARDTAFSIAALGSGSDFTPFLQHLGLASLNLSYGGDSRAGIYHSAYDTYDFYTRFLDTSFVYGVLESQTLGTSLLRLADAPVLPFEFGTVARTYRRYVDEIERAAREVPAMRSLDLTSVRTALASLDSAASRHEGVMQRVDALSARDVQSRWRRLADANRLLYRTERALTDASGLEGRDWYRHLIYAPGFYTGYGVKTMPGIREAVEDKPDLAVAQREAARVTGAIRRLTTQVAEATAALERALR
jgi:N-acetylated-alpha-linked acidic dipeptidase